jgi:hypothetical protein
MVTLIDGHAFRIGNPAYSNLRESGLYQAEVTGFVSAALVVLRLVAGVGSTLIIWRLVFLLLDTTGITLVQLCRMVDKRLPITSGFDSAKHIFWSLFAFLVVILVWPSSIAAPLANSSLQWIPSTQLVHSKSHEYTVPEVKNTIQWNVLTWPTTLVGLPLRATTMGVKNPDYAFVAPRRTQLQYLYLNPHLPSSSIITAPMPYFEVSHIDWRKTAFNSEQEAPNDLSNASMQANPPTDRTMGTLGFWISQKWNASRDIPRYSDDVPTTFYEGKRNVSILVGRFREAGDGDADFGTSRTPCSYNTRGFGQLPLGASQFALRWGSGPPENFTWGATDCFMVAEVSMRIGLTAKQDANITLAGASEDLHILSSLHASNATPVLLPDWTIVPTLDMLTDVLQQLVWLDVGKQHQFNNLDDYLAGMLTVAYHATRSALLHHLQDASTTVTAIPSEPVVRALVDRGRLYGWLVMNAALTVAAMLLWIVQCCTAGSSKTVRDPTLVALTINMDDMCHRDEDGLCNAVALKSGDKKLGRMVWDQDHGGLCRRLRFADQGEVDGNMQTEIPLLDARQHDKLPNY